MTSGTTKSILFESAPISKGEWEGGKLGPEEIVIPKRSIVVNYTYPFRVESGGFKYIHMTTNPQGFTRKEIAEQIMARYRQMYDEEYKKIGGPENIPRSANPPNNDSPYGVWGYDIDQLKLHSMVFDEDRDKYQICIEI
jgi:hypothetical protein